MFQKLNPFSRWRKKKSSVMPTEEPAGPSRVKMNTGVFAKDAPHFGFLTLDPHNVEDTRVHVANSTGISYTEQSEQCRRLLNDERRSEAEVLASLGKANIVGKDLVNIDIEVLTYNLAAKTQLENQVAAQVDISRVLTHTAMEHDVFQCMWEDAHTVIEKDKKIVKQINEIQEAYSNDRSQLALVRLQHLNDIHRTVQAPFPKLSPVRIAIQTYVNVLKMQTKSLQKVLKAKKRQNKILEKQFKEAYNKSKKSKKCHKFCRNKVTRKKRPALTLESLSIYWSIHQGE